MHRTPRPVRAARDEGDVARRQSRSSAVTSSGGRRRGLRGRVADRPRPSARPRKRRRPRPAARPPGSVRRWRAAPPACPTTRPRRPRGATAEPVAVRVVGVGLGAAVGLGCGRRRRGWAGRSAAGGCLSGRRTTRSPRRRARRRQRGPDRSPVTTRSWRVAVVDDLERPDRQSRELETPLLELDLDIAGLDARPFADVKQDDAALVGRSAASRPRSSAGRRRRLVRSRSPVSRRRGRRPVRPAGWSPARSCAAHVASPSIVGTSELRQWR